MLFEKALVPLTKLIQESGLEYVTKSWVETKLSAFFDGDRENSKADKIIEKFVNDNLVEAPTTEILSKLLFANALIQWRLICEQLGYDWGEMLALGQEHLEERYKDFMQDGWAKL